MGRLSIALLLALLANATSRASAQRPATLDQRASLRRLADTWIDSAGGRWVITPVGKTGGMRSAYRAVDGSYEAHALWWYDSTSRLIRAFELNSSGQVLRHAGRFVSHDSLVLDRRGAGRVVQHSVLSWRGPQLAFDAETRSADGTRSTERIVFLRSAPTPAGQDAGAADVDAVDRLSAEIDRCLRAKDLAAFAALWTEDIVLLNPDQPPIVGRSAVKESYRTFFDAFDYVGGHQPLETHTVGDLVIHRGVARGTLTPTGGGNALPINMKYLWLLRRQPDGSLREWRVMINAEPAGKSVARPLPVEGAAFEYRAAGDGMPVVVFTGSENIGQRLYSDWLRRQLMLVHADPSRMSGEKLRTLTMDSVVEDIERARKALGVEKIGVMGHSMFGPVPLEYALKYPEHTQWAILSGALPYTTAKAFRASEEYWATQASAERKALREANHRALSTAGQAGKSASATFWDAYQADVPMRFYDPRWDLRAFTEQSEPSTNMDFVNHFWGSVLKDFDHTMAYRELRVPVLVIAGKYDFGAPYFLWEEVGRRIPDFTLHLFEKAGHNPMLETPEEFDRVLLAWMASRP